MTKLTRRVYPFQVHLLERLPARVREHGFSKRHDAFLDTRHRTLEDYEVVVDFAVADETTHAVLDVRSWVLHLGKEKDEMEESGEDESLRSDLLLRDVEFR